MPFDPFNPENIVGHFGGGWAGSPNIRAFNATIPTGFLALSPGRGGSVGGNTLTGSTQSGAGAFGSVPTVPNPITTASQAIAGNLGNLANIYNIVQGANPLIGKQRGVASEYLSGQVPDDVVNQILQRAAERGIATGSPGSPNANAAYLRALGLTSLDLTGKGFDMASNLGRDVYSMESPFFVKPEDMQAAQLAANIYAASPNPTLAAEEAKRATSIGGPSRLPVSGGTPPIYMPPSFGSSRRSSPASDVSYSMPTFAIGGVGSPSLGSNPDAFASWYDSIANVPASALQSAGPVNPDWFYGADTGYNYGDMHEYLGLPYTDYSGGEWADYDWSQFE